MQTWTVTNQKGGVGKTTSVVSLAGLLAAQGHRVLMVDIDPQGSLTSYFGMDPESIEVSAYNLFPVKKHKKIHEMIQPVESGELSLLPSSTVLVTLERSMVGKEGMGLVLSNALTSVQDQFDYVLIDTSPALGILMINAIASCQQLIVPVQTEYLAIKGLERMMRTLSMVAKSRSSELGTVIVPTMFDRRTQASVKGLRVLRNTYRDRIWPSFIPIDTRFRDASDSGKTPSKYAPDSRGVRAYSALLKYLMGAKKSSDSAQSSVASQPIPPDRSSTNV
ncbi:MAG: ParA family protein [Pseudomonadales bacterium]|jgi:chromosome partitioning protein|nr:ParA family protein [Pseudomonadales bacterium]